MQLSLFEETSHPKDYSALERCLKAEAVSVDIETETRWPGRGPKLDYGLSYSAAVTVIALAWSEGRDISTTVLAAPFDEHVRDFLKTLFARPVPIISHN